MGYIRPTVSHAALEALGTRRIRYGNHGLCIWDDDIGQIIDAKKQAHLKHLALKTGQARFKYNSAVPLQEKKQEN